MAESVIKEEYTELVCEGLDTLAEIYINGERLAQTDNMHRTWRTSLSGVLRAGRNNEHPLTRLPSSERGAYRTMAVVAAHRKGMPAGKPICHEPPAGRRRFTKNAVYGLYSGSYRLYSVHRGQPVPAIFHC